MQPSPPASSHEDEFPYGWRYVKRQKPDGTVELDQVPLTLEDVLHPEEDDVMPQRPVHELDCGYLASVFRTRPLAPPVGWVTADLRIDWDVPGLRAHSPDVAVFVGLKAEPDLEKGTLRRAALGGRCLLAVEVVSPDTRNNDAVVKVEHYHRAGVRMYVLVDQEVEEGPRTLVAYRWAPGGYEPVALDEQGRLALPFLGLDLVMRDNRPVCLDAETGRQLGDYAEVSRLLDEADARNAEQERLITEAVEERAAALMKAREDAAARAEVERRLADVAEQLRQAQELLARLQPPAV